VTPENANIIVAVSDESASWDSWPKNSKAGADKNDRALRLIATSVRVLNLPGRLEASKSRNGKDHVDQPTAAPGRDATISKGTPIAKASKLVFILRTW
jgi:hypothetical protein